MRESTRGSIKDARSDHKKGNQKTRTIGEFKKLLQEPNTPVVYDFNNYTGHIH
jgi:hypothetical protein